MSLDPPSAGDTLIWLWVTAAGVAEVAGHTGGAVVCGLAAATVALSQKLTRREVAEEAQRAAADAGR